MPWPACPRFVHSENKDIEQVFSVPKQILRPNIGFSKKLQRTKVRQPQEAHLRHLDTFKNVHVIFISILKIKEYLDTG